jgi:hypothetical protein
MNSTRRHSSGPEKVAVLKRHLLEKRPGPARTLSKPGKVEYCALIGLFVRFSVWLHLRRRTENER